MVENIKEVAYLPLVVSAHHPPRFPEEIEDVNTLTRGLSALGSWANQGLVNPEVALPNLPKVTLLSHLLTNTGDVYRRRHGLNQEIEDITLISSVENLLAFNELFSENIFSEEEAGQTSVTEKGDNGALNYVNRNLRRAVMHISEAVDPDPQLEEVPALEHPNDFLDIVNKLSGLNHDLGNELAIILLGTEMARKLFIPERIQLSEYNSTLRKIMLISSRAFDIVRGSERPLTMKVQDLYTDVVHSMHPPQGYPLEQPFVITKDIPQELGEHSVEYSLGLFSSLYGDIADNMREEYEELISKPETNRESLIPFGEVVFQASEDGKYLYTIFRNKGEGFPQEIIEHGFKYGLSIRPEGIRKMRDNSGIGLAFHQELLEKHGGSLKPENTPYGAQLTIKQKLI